MTDKPTITQAEDLADAICGCSNRDQHRRDVALIEAFREAAVTELQAEVERLREALQMAARQFRFYEDSHLLKETTDGIAKAVANRRCAEQCEIALAQKEPVE